MANTYFGERQSTIARFDPIENIWTKLGNLKVPRWGLGVIEVDNEFIVVGGYGYTINAGLAPPYGNAPPYDPLPTESCKLNGQSITCTPREPFLNQFAFYPEIILNQ